MNIIDSNSNSVVLYFENPQGDQYDDIKKQDWNVNSKPINPKMCLVLSFIKCASTHPCVLDVISKIKRLY